MPLILLSLFGLLVIVVLGVLFYAVVSISFVRLGIPRALVGILFVAILVGSFVNVPVWSADQGQTVLFQRGHFVFREAPHVRSTVIAVNVGGAVIPLLLSMWLFARAPLFRTMLAIGIVAIAAYMLSRVVPGEGVVLNGLIPPIVAAITAIALAWRRAAPVAYVSGVVGTLIGADLLNLGELLDQQGTYLSIGGAGVFDGIFLVGIVAAFLSPGPARVSRRSPAQRAG